jgi:hypothetical protein
MTTHEERVLELRQTYNHAYTNSFRMAVLGAQDVDRMISRIATLEEQHAFLSEQISKLADYIMENVPGEPSQSEGAVDTAIRIMQTSRTSTS